MRNIFTLLLTHTCPHAHDSISARLHFCVAAGPPVVSTHVKQCSAHSHILTCAGVQFFGVFTLTYIASHWELLSGRNARTNVNLHLSDFDTDRKRQRKRENREGTQRRHKVLTVRRGAEGDKSGRTLKESSKEAGLKIRGSGLCDDGSVRHFRRPHEDIELSDTGHFPLRPSWSPLQCGIRRHEHPLPCSLPTAGVRMIQCIFSLCRRAAVQMLFIQNQSNIVFSHRASVVCPRHLF